ncbi:uncharacterized protein [Typha latifolia]|uniref:uncharacterized protein isoform X1 n=1 Tax=Typha latifolia TaxID=4733 RepID=UPI003C30DB3F
MEDAWRAKCGSTWTPQPSAPSSMPPPPPAAMGAQLQPAQDMGQLDMSSCYLFHPFNGQEAILQNRALVQEQMVFNTLNLDYGSSGKTELGNSFLALLSGDYSYFPNSRSSLAKLHVSNVFSVNNTSCAPPHVSIPPLPENHRNDALGKRTDHSSSIASGSLLLPKYSVSPSNFPQAAPSTHGMPGSSVQVHALNFQASGKMPFDPNSSISCHVPALLKGHPRVFCINTVGELFVNDVGLFGVICFCHRLKMSVAKFCEHSGESSNKTGEVVRLENGMTVAQWRKNCLGIMAPEDGAGWDWSDQSVVKGGSVESKASNLSDLLKIPWTMDNNEPFSGLGKLGEPRSNPTYVSPPYMEGGGGITLEELVREKPGHAHQRKPFDGNNLFLKNNSSLTQCMKPALAQSQITQTIRGSPICLGVLDSDLTTYSEQNKGCQLASSSVKSMGQFGNSLITHPHLGTKKTVSRDNRISRGISPSEAFLVRKDSAPSNTELKLGQPSQVSQTIAGLFPTSMQYSLFGAVSDSQNPQSHQPLANGTGPKEMTKSRQSFQEVSPEALLSIRRHTQQSLGTVNAGNNSESAELTSDGTRNSLISLFLSHLEGNNRTESADDVLNSKERFHPRVLVDESHSVKCNLSDLLVDLNDRTERRHTTNKSDLSDFVRLEQKVTDNGINASTCLLDRNQRSNDRVPALSSSGNFPYGSSDANGRQFFFHFNQPCNMLVSEPDAGTFKQSGEVPYAANIDDYHMTLRSQNPAPYSAGRPGPLELEGEMSLSSIRSLGSSLPGSLSKRRDFNTSQHFMDDFRSHAFRHVNELPTHENFTTFHEKNPQHEKLCCLSSLKLQNRFGQGDLAAREELSEGSHCGIHQDTSKIAVRSGGHSCSICCPNGGVQLCAGNSNFTGPNEYCNCTTSIQRASASHCSREHGIQFSACHLERPCIRFEKLSKISLGENTKHEISNQNEQRPYLSRKCCHSVLQKCAAGCNSGSGKSSDALNEQSNLERPKIMHPSPTYEKDYMFHDSKRIRLGQCDCLENSSLTKNYCQASFWRDVPRKVTRHPCNILAEKHEQVVEVTGLFGDRLAEKNAAHQESESMKKQQTSNTSSGSSAPALTEISVSIEPNKVGSCTTENANGFCDFVVDEGSGTDKCASSDEALVSTECEQAVRAKSGLSYFPGPKSCSFIGNLSSENSSKTNRLSTHISAGSRGQGNRKQKKNHERVRKADNKIFGFTTLNSESHNCNDKAEVSSSRQIEVSPPADSGMQKTLISSCKSSNVKRKRSSLSCSKPLSIKKFQNHDKIVEHESRQLDDQDYSLETLKSSDGEKEKQDLPSLEKEKHFMEKWSHADARKPPKYMSLSCIGREYKRGRDSPSKKVSPIVCGNSGIISTGIMNDERKNVKIVSLSVILRKAKRCSATKNAKDLEQAKLLETKNVSLGINKGDCSASSFSKSQYGTDNSSSLLGDESEQTTSKNEEFATDSLVTYGKFDCQTDCKILLKSTSCQAKRRSKDSHRHSLRQLSRRKRKETKTVLATPSGSQSLNLTNTDVLDMSTALHTKNTVARVKNESAQLRSSRILKYTALRDTRSSSNHEGHLARLSQVNLRRLNTGRKFLLDSDAFCCVCGSSNQEDVNILIECNQCLIRVHQACYGVPKVPRGSWYCRSCKTKSEDIVCVLCGYGGGAMTRALKSRNIVKSLLKVWTVRTLADDKLIPLTERTNNETNSPVEASEHGKYDLLPSPGLNSSNTIPSTSTKLNLHKQTSIKHPLGSMPSNFQTSNSIINGLFDPSVRQWVHMVCGLWTPGTRCPNVDTMSAFDVSGAAPAKKNAACSMCNRHGGSCIECRVPDCSVIFHPWCAHQKGLLQSEIEGSYDEKVGFYGRCLHHVTLHRYDNDTCHVDPKEECSRNKDWTCARTAGFKGRKSEEGSSPNYKKPQNDGGGCIVSQEQINAWLHINGQKSCARGILKPPCSDIEHDFRKEYIRYKQSKGWKNLVVYKSGIHALGLYTSQFIARGAMVVEYVGEIVGLRVADKREIEYQSGRRLQYKSACYFFRIDKEHIIDATRKGGIARFVNHSCLPNCVAKVISVRNEKKVVFFAERDINPGEEITYDYHFNHEDEGQKIPCFCNSKNCRRYLN